MFYATLVPYLACLLSYSIGFYFGRRSGKAVKSPVAPKLKASLFVPDTRTYAYRATK